MEVLLLVTYFIRWIFINLKKADAEKRFHKLLWAFEIDASDGDGDAFQAAT